MKRLALALIVSCTTQLAAEQRATVATVSPESVGLSSVRLERIASVMRDHIASGRFPGAVALIERKGKLVYSESWGTTTPESIFRIYSMSKPVTSVAVMMLHEEGRFLLSDPVSAFLPALAEPEVLVEIDIGRLDEKRSIAETADREITIRDLLRHTSGYTYGLFDDSAVDELYVSQNVFDFDAPLSRMIEKLGELPLKYQPGTVWNYSVSTDVLGRLIEVVSGTTLDRFLDDRVFTPLGMDDTGFVVPDADRERLATLYERGEPATDVGANFTTRRPMLSGGAGLVSTVDDYLRFCRMLLAGGELEGTRILSRKSVEAMTTDQLGDIATGTLTEGYGFGLGLAVAADVGRMGKLGSAGEYNWSGLAGTTFFVDPAEELIGIFMIQNLYDDRPRDQFKALVYQAIID